MCLVRDTSLGEIMKIYTLLTTLILLTACNSQKDFEARLKKTIKENPNIVFDAIKEEPEKFMDIVKDASVKARDKIAQQRQKDEEEKLEDAYANPFIPKITNQSPTLGPKDAPITLVEYSDFECPYCQRGAQTVKELMSKYKGKIRFVFKHLPLSFHPQAMISAKYFEAIKLQSMEKAFAFHNLVFKNQSKLKQGENFLKQITKSLKIDDKRFAKDLQSEQVMSRITADLEEAKQFGMQGTPGYLLNGIPVRGAYPVTHFVSIIEKLKSEGKIKI
jgi:protein-disulfide isomerase